MAHILISPWKHERRPAGAGRLLHVGALRVLPLAREGDGRGEVVVGLVVGRARDRAEDGVARIAARLGRPRGEGGAGAVLELHHPEALGWRVRGPPLRAGHAHPGLARGELATG